MRAKKGNERVWIELSTKWWSIAVYLDKFCYMEMEEMPILMHDETK